MSHWKPLMRELRNWVEQLKKKIGKETKTWRPYIPCDLSGPDCGPVSG